MLLSVLGWLVCFIIIGLLFLSVLRLFLSEVYSLLWFVGVFFIGLVGLLFVVVLEFGLVVGVGGVVIGFMLLLRVIWLYLVLVGGVDLE